MGTGLNALGEKQVNFSTNGGPDGLAGTQGDPAVAALANGDFVVVYENPHSDDSLLAHFFDASGNAIGPPVSSGLQNGVVDIDPAPHVSVDPAVAATPDGGFLVAYTDTSVTYKADERHYRGQQHRCSPLRQHDGTQRSLRHRHRSRNHTPTERGSGRRRGHRGICRWNQHRYVGIRLRRPRPGEDDVFYGFLNSNGQRNLLAVRSRWMFTDGFQGEARVATSGNLAAIVYTYDQGASYGQDIVLTLFNSSGTALAAPIHIFGDASLDAFSDPDVAALSDGRFVVVARDDTTSALVVSIYDPVTHAATPVLNLPGVLAAGAKPHVAGVTGGGFVVTFDDSSGNVIEQRFGPDGSVLFNPGVANSVTTGTQDQNAIAANASGTVFVAWQDGSSGNPNSTDADTRIEAQAFHAPPLPQENFNGDLHSDILWQNANGQASVWEMSGNTRTGGGPVSANPGPAWRAIGPGDFNDDGFSDILFQNTTTGQASVWEMNGHTRIGGGPVSPNPGTAWKAIGTGDFDGDGHSDILWQNASSGQASIWEMNGNTRTGGGPVTPNPGPSWTAIGSGDFNHDGHSDILWQNKSTGQASIWEMNGNALIGGGPVSPNPGPAWKAIGTGDFNNDGRSDILFQNTSSGQLSIWEMSGNTLIGGGPVSPNAGPSWHATGTGDFNGDGFADILLQNTSGQTSIWEMDGSTLMGGGPVSPNPGANWRTV